VRFWRKAGVLLQHNMVAGLCAADTMQLLPMARAVAALVLVVDIGISRAFCQITLLHGLNLA
jgi:hypothetical protein